MVDHHRSLPTCYYCHCHHAATASPRIDQLRTTINRGWRGLAGSDVFLDRVQVVLFGRLCTDIALVENNYRKTRVVILYKLGREYSLVSSRDDAPRY